MEDIAVDFHGLTVGLVILNHEGELVTRGNDLRTAVDDHLVAAGVVDHVVYDGHITQGQVVGLLARPRRKWRKVRRPESSPSSSTGRRTHSR